MLREFQRIKMKRAVGTIEGEQIRVERIHAQTVYTLCVLEKGLPAFSGLPFRTEFHEFLAFVIVPDFCCILEH